MVAKIGSIGEAQVGAVGLKPGRVAYPGRHCCHCMIVATCKKGRYESAPFFAAGRSTTTLAGARRRCVVLVLYRPFHSTIPGIWYCIRLCGGAVQ